MRSAFVLMGVALSAGAASASDFVYSTDAYSVPSAGAAIILHLGCTDAPLDTGVGVRRGPPDSGDTTTDINDDGFDDVVFKIDGEGDGTVFLFEGGAERAAE